MITADALRSMAYDQFEAETLALHRLICNGRGGSEAAASLRGRLAGVWPQLTDDQQEFGNDFAGDLYMLHPSEPEMYEPATDEERSPQVLGFAIKDAWDRGDWATALTLLRRGASFWEPQHIAYLRARAYGELGRPAVALTFIQFARRRDPTRVPYQILELDWYGSVFRPDEVESLAWSYVSDPAVTPAIAVMASGMLIARVQDLDDAIAQTALNRLIPHLLRIADLLAVGGSADPYDLLANARVQLAVCLEGVDLSRSLATYQAVIGSPASGAVAALVRAQVREHVRRYLIPAAQPADPASARQSRRDLNRIVLSTNRSLLSATI